MTDKNLEALKLEHKRKLQISLRIMATIFIISLAVLEFDPAGKFTHTAIKSILIALLGYMGINSINKHMEDLKEIESQVNDK